MGLACKIAGHKWHKTPDDSGALICSTCGIDSNENYAQAALSALSETSHR